AFGKTGTARKFIDGKYNLNRHYVSFLGFFPADKPQYGMLFMFDEPSGGLTGGDVAAPLFKKIGDAIMRYRNTGRGLDQEPDLKLSLRDWPVSENDEASVHVEVGKVPDLKGLALKAAVHRVVMAGGTPRIEGLTELPEGPYLVQDQSPEAGAALAFGSTVKIKMRVP
ncbi:MAG: penicillin-binding transpeptidase domain-containing protein, partial [Holophaga sp.]|nr:penicillin-binding transpeptidase domain-containing protein [Holophaga sp.]